MYVRNYLAQSNRFVFSNSRIDDAMSIPTLNFRSPGTHRYCAGVRYLAVYLLSKSGRTETRKGAISALTRLLENSLFPGEEPELRGSMYVWNDAHFSSIVAFAKNIPEVWNSLSSAAKSRIDWVMKIGCYVGNIQHNAENVCYYDITFTSASNYNPNQRNGMVSWMTHAYVYFGGAEAVNTILSEFDYDEMIAAMDGFGWSVMKQNFIGADTIAALAGNFTKDTTTIGVNGVKEPFTFKGRYITDPAGATGFEYTRHSTAIDYTPYNLFKAEELGFTIGRRTVDDTGITGSECDAVSKIKGGYSSPHLGEDVMPFEYSIGGSRSSGDYVKWGMQSACWHLITLIAFDLFPSREARADAITKMTNAYDIWRYREKNSLWYDSVFCEYRGAFDLYAGCDYLEDALGCCVHPTFENYFAGQR